MAAIDWREASADALALPDESFDVVLCQLGLIVVQQPVVTATART